MVTRIIVNVNGKVLETAATVGVIGVVIAQLGSQP
jgi:hypothetical protein